MSSALIGDDGIFHSFLLCYGRVVSPTPCGRGLVRERSPSTVPRQPSLFSARCAGAGSSPKVRTRSRAAARRSSWCRAGHRSITSPFLPHRASKQVKTPSSRLTLKVRPRPSPRWIGQAQRRCPPLPRNLCPRPRWASTRSRGSCRLTWAKSMYVPSPGGPACATFSGFFRVSCGSAGENRHSHDGKRHASSGFPGKGRAEVESATVEEDRSAKVIAVAEAEGTVLDRLDP